MPFAIHGVLAVGEVAPHRVREELVLRLLGPVLVVDRMPRIVADDFLQEQDVGAEHPQPVTQVMHDHPPVEMREPLVDVVGGDGQRLGHEITSMRIMPIVTKWSHCALCVPLRTVDAICLTRYTRRESHGSLGQQESGGIAVHLDQDFGGHARKQRLDPVADGTGR